MLRQSLMIIKGYIIWLQFRVKEHLDDKKFVLIVTEENEKVDQYALKYLDYVMERKYTKEALVIVSNQGTAKKVSKYHYKHQIKIKIMPFQKIKLLYKWYCMDGRRKNGSLLLSRQIRIIYWNILSMKQISMKKMWYVWPYII